MENKGWLTGWAYCPFFTCGYSWITVLPPWRNSKSLECPKCRRCYATIRDDPRKSIDTRYVQKEA